MSKITTCLWFDHQAETAAHFYVETFRACGQTAEIESVMHYSESMPKPKGSVLAVNFTLADYAVMALNGGPQFTFSPAISLFVKCADQTELDRFWDKLGDGGMPNQCGWLTDRFGLSWQIVPAILGEMLQDPDRTKADRVLQAVMKMIKLDIRGLQKAYDNS